MQYLELTPLFSDETKLSRNQKVANDIYNLLSENQLWADCEPCEFGVRISISWGDWKHDHLATKWLLERAGYDYSGSVVTESDGDDCYSAAHYVRVA